MSKDNKKYPVLPNIHVWQREQYHKENNRLLKKQEAQRQAERTSDRWFTAKMLIIGAVIGILATKLADYFFK